MRFVAGGISLALFATSATGVAIARSAETVAAAPTAAPKAAATPVAWAVDSKKTYPVAREIGTGSINKTDTTWDVYGADLGAMFTYQDKTYTVFGVTFGGPPAYPFDSVTHMYPRPNTMAISSDNTPSDGLTYDSMIASPDGRARALIYPATTTGRTLNVTNGTAVGNRIYLDFMDVILPFGLDDWKVDHSGIAYSDDGGQTWVRDTPVTWPGKSNFAQVAFAQQDGFVYLFGIPHGRLSGVQLARVPSDSVLVPTAYTYWTGTTWSTDITSAKTIIPPDVGEPSVEYNSYYKKWIMLSGNQRGSGILGDIVLRTADVLTGPWSKPQIVVAGANSPIYAPYMTPTGNDGPDIWFNLSDSFKYNVEMMHTQLKPASAPSAPRTPSAVPGKHSATLTWRVPATTNGSPITAYVVTPYKGGVAQPAVTFKSAATKETVVGLTSGKKYTFKVAAKNGLGIGPSSVMSNSVTPT
jgi:Domain of unknown function (DUF4185)/Fibronectin type III domain